MNIFLIGSFYFFSDMWRICGENIFSLKQKQKKEFDCETKFSSWLLKIDREREKGKEINEWSYQSTVRWKKLWSKKAKKKVKKKRKNVGDRERGSVSRFHRVARSEPDVTQDWTEWCDPLCLHIPIQKATFRNCPRAIYMS